jgi:hypothetical protein
MANILEFVRAEEPDSIFLGKEKKFKEKKKIAKRIIILL